MDFIKNIWRNWLMIAGVLSIIVTIFLGPQHTIKSWSIVVFAILTVLAISLSLATIYTLLLRCHPLRICYTKTDTEVDDAYRLGKTVYDSIRKHYPSESVVRQWWSNYPQGVLRLLDCKDNLWGYFSIWPLSRTVFDELKSGALSEDDLGNSHIEKKEDAPFEYWYIADVCRKKRPRGAPQEFSKYLLSTLISGAMENLFQHKDVKDSIELIAFAATIPGEKLLIQYGFTKVKTESPSPKVDRIYVRMLTERQGLDMIKKSKDAARKIANVGHYVLQVRSIRCLTKRCTWTRFAR